MPFFPSLRRIGGAVAVLLVVSAPVQPVAPAVARSLPDSGAPAEAPPLLPSGAEAKTPPEKPALQRSVACAACHQEIYEEWRSSSMARTIDLSRWCLDGSHAALESMGRGEEIGERCYACHAPAAYRRGATPYEARDEEEGVGCDVCHSIAAVDVSDPLGFPRLTLQPGPKRGARSDVKADHEVVVSPLHARAELCAGCHYFADPANGLPVDWTYPQWSESPQAKRGETCQDCHMPRRPGRLSEQPGSPRRSDVASHLFHGARNLPTLRSALDLRIRLEEDGGTRTAVVEVENVGAGHNIPGGGGGIRQLELLLSAAGDGGREILAARHAYEIRYYRADGRQTSGSDPRAVRHVDSGIRAGETREARLVLPREADVDTVTADLRYWYVSAEAQQRNGLDLESAIAGPVQIARRTLALADTGDDPTR